ncbi:hypothetical protein [Methylobacterium sp. 37f]|uniref:hypothetical protein n=1 Tax=Methylobacterium sp. 37f TaxID=2817058 RepID=UPI001FFDB20B|nr:hypothetical protein [Methylobacterium sp. 37f]MCK2053640.1 hypothetical protein [Methylobacterium sp. 37f]
MAYARARETRRGPNHGIGRSAAAFRSGNRDRGCRQRQVRGVRIGGLCQTGDPAPPAFSVSESALDAGGAISAMRQPGIAVGLDLADIGRMRVCPGGAKITVDRSNVGCMLVSARLNRPDIGGMRGIARKERRLKALLRLRGHHKPERTTGDKTHYGCFYDVHDSESST